MPNKTCILFLLLFLSVPVKSSFSQTDDVEGTYMVGKTSCTIEWDTRDKTYKVYWNEGTGYTTLFYQKELPNGNLVYEEYESDGATYTGTFTFKDDTYRKGQYERSDGKKFNVKRK